MSRIIVAEKHTNCEHLLGTFLDHSHYDLLIEEDCDFYAPVDRDNLFGADPHSEDKAIFKFRKGFFSKEEQKGAYDGLRDAAVQSQNRGIAAGERTEKLNNRDWVTDRQLAIIDMMLDPVENVFGNDELAELVNNKVYKGGDSPRGTVWLASKVEENKFDFEVWAKECLGKTKDERRAEAKRIYDEYISKTTYANQVFSGIAGWFDRYPRIPYGRATSYTANNPEQFKLSYPFLQKLAKGFQELMPKRYSAQVECCNKIDKAFYVPETPFTTLTVNKTFRTAAHRDAGDLSTGFSNLSVLSNGIDYTGGYLVFPEFRVAVNIRPGDLLLVNNHEGIHGNTEIFVEEGGERISLVCYFREGMLNLGEKAYEDTRREFVELNKTNEKHPHWRPLFNGVYPNMWSSVEWYGFLEKKLGRETLLKYHPEAKSFDYYQTFECGKNGQVPDCSKCSQTCVDRVEVTV